MEKDIILKNLRINSRITLTELSKMSRAPVSTVFNRLRKQERYIYRYTSIIDFEKLGFGLNTFFFIKSRKKQELLGFLLNCFHVNNIHRCRNNYDLIVNAFFKDMAELHGFCEKMDEYILKKQEFHVVEDLKREGFFTAQKQGQLQPRA